MFISFAWTTEPFLANAKRMTRRYWKGSHAKKFTKGKLVDALDKLPHRGGIKIGKIRVERDAYQERTSLMDESDYIFEGLYWMEQNNIIIRDQHPRDFFDKWIAKDDLVWVVEFEKVN